MTESNGDGSSRSPRVAAVTGASSGIGRAVAVALGARGSTRIQTLPALSIDEFVQTIQ